MWYALLVCAVILTAVAYRARRIIARFPTSEFDPLTAYLGTDLGVVICSGTVLLVVLGNLLGTPAVGRAGRLEKTATALTSRQEIGRQLGIALATEVRRDREHLETLVRTEGHSESAAPKPEETKKNSEQDAKAKEEAAKAEEAKKAREKALAKAKAAQAKANGEVVSEDSSDSATSGAAPARKKRGKGPALGDNLAPIEQMKVLIIWNGEMPLAYHAAIIAGLKAGFAECRFTRLEDGWQEVPLRLDTSPAPVSKARPSARGADTSGTDGSSAADNGPLVRSVAQPLTSAKLDEIHGLNKDHLLIVSLVDLPSDYARSQTAADVANGELWLAVLSTSAFNLGEQIYRGQISSCIAPVPVSFREGDFAAPLDADNFEDHYLVLTHDTVIPAVTRYPRLFPVRITRTQQQ